MKSPKRKFMLMKQLKISNKIKWMFNSIKINSNKNKSKFLIKWNAIHRKFNSKPNK